MARCHHLLKTFFDWQDEQQPDATVIWTSPTGQTNRTAPGGVDLFPTWGSPPAEHRNQSAATGLVSARPASHEFATASGYSDISTRPIVDSTALARGRSPTARTATECARACSSSKVAQHQPILHLDQRPARTRRAATRVAAAARTTAGTRRSAVLMISTPGRRTRSSP